MTIGHSGSCHRLVSIILHDIWCVSLFHVLLHCNTISTDTFGGMGGKCSEINYFPNATVAEYGLIDYEEDDIEGICHKIMTDIYVRGPFAATINAEPSVKFTGGIFTETGHSQRTNHIVAIAGWGTDPDTGIKYWIIRHSWGQYWAEMGNMRLEMSKNLLGIEGEIAWVIPRSYTTTNYACYEDGSNCVVRQEYVDPSNYLTELKTRLAKGNKKTRLGVSSKWLIEKSNRRHDVLRIRFWDITDHNIMNLIVGIER
jgi:hypothetical protein